MVVSHVESPSKFWVQDGDSEKELVKLQAMLTQHCQSSPPLDPAQLKQGEAGTNLPSPLVLPSPPPLGLLCAAMSSTDGHWYRAELERVQLLNPSYANVFYYDYGKADTVTLQR